MRNTPEGTEPGHVGTGLHADPVLQQIISNVQDGILVYSRDLRYLVWNPVMERLSGRTAEEVLGGDARELFPHLKETGVLDAIEQVLNGAPPITIDYEYTDTKTGNRLWISDTCSPLLDDRGNIMGVIGTVRDITPYKRLEAELRQSQERFRDLFENAPLGYQSLDEQGNFIEINDTWRRILGYSKEEVIGRNFSEFIHPDFQEVFRENFPKFKTLSGIRNDPQGRLHDSRDLRRENRAQQRRLLQTDALRAAGNHRTQARGADPADHGRDAGQCAMQHHRA